MAAIDGINLDQAGASAGSATHPIGCTRLTVALCMRFLGVELEAIGTASITVLFRNSGWRHSNV
jgi:hypothetical protein